HVRPSLTACELLLVWLDKVCADGVRICHRHPSQCPSLPCGDTFSFIISVRGLNSRLAHPHNPAAYGVLSKFTPAPNTHCRVGKSGCETDPLLHDSSGTGRVQPSSSPLFMGSSRTAVFNVAAKVSGARHGGLCSCG